MDKPNDYMGAADDLVYRMRMLAGSGDVDSGATIVREMLELYNDASRYDRECDSDNSAMILSYVLDQFEMVADNLRGIPAGNRSRTATEAAKARAA